MRKRKLLFTAAEILLLLGAFPLSGNHIPALRPPVQRQWIPAAEATVTAPGIGTFRPAEIVRSIPLDGEWYFSGLSGSPQPFPPVGEPPDMNLAKNWKTIPVPKSFYYHPGSKYEEVLTNGNLYFRGWYAREFELPATFGSVVLEFDAIGYAGTLFINGKPAGKHHAISFPFARTSPRSSVPEKMRSCCASTAISPINKKDTALPVPTVVAGMSGRSGAVSGDRSG